MRRRQPQRLGRYELVLPIARGGMGEVYLARTRGLEGFERVFALKLVDGALDPELARDLVEEAKLAALIHHRNVVGVIDVGVDDDITFLAMEYVEGPSLASLLQTVTDAGGTLPLGIGMRILLDTLEGLHAAHELRDANGAPLGIVHRDVSPANVLVGIDGVAKLADFGIARALSRSSRTSTGIVKGKFSYMSPEQARGTVLDRRADVWSAGVIAWELVAGRKLFPLGNDPSTLLAVVSADLPGLAGIVDVAHELDAAVMMALTREAKLRCSSALALAAALESACESAGIEIASHAEVAETVRRLCGATLLQRRSHATSGRPRPELARTVPDSGTFSPATGLMPRDRLFQGRTWAWSGTGIAITAVAALAFFGYGRDSSPTSGARAAELPPLERGVVATGSDTDRAPVRPSDDAAASSASAATSASSVPREPVPSKKVAPRITPPRGPRLVEDDPYKKDP